MHNKQTNKQTIKQIFFPDKIYFEKRLFNIDDVTKYDHVFMARVVFVD